MFTFSNTHRIGEGFKKVVLFTVTFFAALPLWLNAQTATITLVPNNGLNYVCEGGSIEINVDIDYAGTEPAWLRIESAPGVSEENHQISAAHNYSNDPGLPPGIVGDSYWVKVYLVTF